jgi:hypothetical protein
MALAVFPTLLGLGFPVVKRPIFSTLVSPASSGIEVRVANYTAAILEWDLPFTWLSQRQAQPDFEKLYGLYLQSLGQWGAFLYKDPDDYFTRDPANYDVQGSVQFGVGDGFSHYFALGTNIGGGYEEVSDPDVITSISPTPTSITDGLAYYASAPGLGVPLMVNMTYKFRVRFATDESDFEYFLKDVWENKKLTLRQVRMA